MNQFSNEFEGVRHETSQWKLWAGTQLGRDVRTVMSRYKRLDLKGEGTPEIRAFHLEDEEAQARATYWAPTSPTRKHYLPRRFGAFVHRSKAPNAALIVEFRPDERRVAVVKLSFEWEDEYDPRPIGSADLRACPTDRWARLAAEAILHTAQHNHPRPGEVTLRDRHDEAHQQHVYQFALDDDVAKAIATAAPDRRSSKTPRALREELDAVAAAYRHEIERHAGGEPGHAHPILHIMETFGMKTSTAKRRVKQARELGLLGPALPARAGERPIDT